MTPISPGFAFITGVFSCYNQRVLDPVHKPKTITFDAEIPIGDDPKGNLQCVKGLLHYFVRSHEQSPEDERKYFVSGKMVCISQQDADDVDMMEYDFQIDALTVSAFILH
jgi:hypothetical protein